jgi:hypothetical protein
MCTAYIAKSITEEAYQEHTMKKDEAAIAKDAAKKSANDSTLIATMDLQSVLLSPKLLVSDQYYKQKLHVHNFTVYCSNNGKVDMYVWHEGEGGVSANEFASCIEHYILDLQENFQHVILISDGCNYQNRNKVLASVLSRIAKEKKIVIEQLFLEKGHTMMEVDSIHSSLEHFFKAPIYAPSDYIGRMNMAREGKNYNVHLLDYSFSTIMKLCAQCHHCVRQKIKQEKLLFVISVDCCISLMEQSGSK